VASTFFAKTFFPTFQILNFYPVTKLHNLGATTLGIMTFSKTTN
jgi:hypothetical protein